MKQIATKSFLKFATRGRMAPLIDDAIRNPYAHEEPGQMGDEGVSYRVRMGDEYGGSASVGGTTAREGYPKDIKRTDDLDGQRKRNIPSSSHMFVADENESQDSMTRGVGDGANDQRFTDERDRLPTDEETFGPSPSSIQNMNTMGEKIKRRTIYDRLRDRVKGAYYG